MISYIESSKVFHLSTENTSYVMELLPSGHLGHLYYGKKLTDLSDPVQLKIKFDIEVGNQVLYDQNDRTFNLNTSFLEFSTFGKGDQRSPMCHFRFSDGSRVSDFLYDSFEIINQKPSFSNLPESHLENESGQTLKITLIDSNRSVAADLYYTPLESVDCISRRLVLRNLGEEEVLIEKASSMNLDMFNKNYQLISLDGAWIRERNITRRNLEYGIYTIDSKKGVSGNDHNPYIALVEPTTSEEFGRCYGFSLVYSGDFEASVEVSPHQILRVLFGVNSFDFYHYLKSGDSFVTPEVILSYSDQGMNQLSQHFHECVKKNIIQKQWVDKERPIVLNNWEATYFEFTEKKIIQLAKTAKKLGIEMFVLDDGWFGKRDDDHSSLGDWYPNKKKLPHGLNHLSKKIQSLGLDFGLWFEPEMISLDSDLYRLHPDWALKHPQYKPSFGRNQLILDLTNPSVTKYLYETLGDIIDNAKVSYVKWDMNRNFSDIYSSYLSSKEQGMLNYRYYEGLTWLLKKLTSRFPDVLFESCASGGNRFDLGMLTFMPQTWTSDNTDGIERLRIQYGTSLVYPPSTMGAHVSDIPNQQTLRQVPLETRFNTAMFGLLGYELDVTKLTPFERKVVKNQIAFYKEHRKTLQWGTFRRYLSPFNEDQCLVSSYDKKNEEMIVGLYQLLERPNFKYDRFYIKGIDPDKSYRVKNRTQYFNLSKFGHLIHHALPIRINANGILFHLLKNRYALPVEHFEEVIHGDTVIHSGFSPYQPFIGSGYHDKVRLMGDYGSRTYIIKEEKRNENA